MAYEKRGKIEEEYRSYLPNCARGKHGRKAQTDLLATIGICLSSSTIMYMDL